MIFFKKPAPLLRRILHVIRSENGFTLLEILVATAISALIMAMLSTSFKSIITSIEDMTGYTEFYENLNMAIYRIDKDISNTYFTIENKNLCFISETIGANSVINFVSVIHNDINLRFDITKEYHYSDIREVGYSLLPGADRKGEMKLIRRESPHFDKDPEKGGESNILLNNVTGLIFEFKSGNDWVKKWDTRINSKIPEAVRTTLILKNYKNATEEFLFISFIKMKN